MEVISNAECIHGLTVRTCDLCLGVLRRVNYNMALQNVMPNVVPRITRTDARCERCARRGPCKGNRITVKLPRPPMMAFGQGIPPYPPSVCGPVIEAPKVYKATHRAKNGEWSCDRCDPEWAERQPLVRRKERSREVLSRQDVIGG